MSEADQIVHVSSDDTKSHGLPPVSITVDARSAAMSVRLFPAKDVYLQMSGPPGAPLVVMIWDCTGLPTDPEAVVRAKYVPTWSKAIEIGSTDRGTVFGADRSGVTFATGSGHGRIAWFGFVLEYPVGNVLVTLGVGGRDPERVTAADVLSNSSIKTVLATLQIRP
jgi:hypothetical protein